MEMNRAEKIEFLKNAANGRLKISYEPDFSYVTTDELGDLLSLCAKAIGRFKGPKYSTLSDEMRDKFDMSYMKYGETMRNPTNEEILALPTDDQQALELIFGKIKYKPSVNPTSSIESYRKGLKIR